MTNEQLKDAVAVKLAESGIWINRHAAMRIICQKVSEHTGRHRGASETMYGYLARYVGMQRPQNVQYVAAFKPMRVAAHPRAAEIDAGQPPFMTPHGAVGNGSENSPVWRR